MDGIVNLGPLAFATDRLLAVALLVGFVFAMDRIAAQASGRVRPATGLAILVGLVAARVAFVFTYRDLFARDWASAFAFWQGGFNAWAGFLAAAVVLIWKARPAAVMHRSLAALALFGAAWFAGSALLQQEPRPLPDLPSLARLDGRQVTIDELADGPVVINLWATWCPPCRRELPMLAEAAEDSDIPILLINQGEDGELVRNYLLANGVPGSAVLLDPPASATRALGNAALPTTLFIDASGQLVATHVGEISRAALAAQINDLEGE